MCVCDPALPGPPSHPPKGYGSTSPGVEMTPAPWGWVGGYVSTPVFEAQSRSEKVPNVPSETERKEGEDAMQ